MSRGWGHTPCVHATLEANSRLAPRGRAPSFPVDRQTTTEKITLPQTSLRAVTTNFQHMKQPLIVRWSQEVLSPANNCRNHILLASLAIVELNLTVPNEKACPDKMCTVIHVDRVLKRVLRGYVSSSLCISSGVHCVLSSGWSHSALTHETHINSLTCKEAYTHPLHITE